MSDILVPSILMCIREFLNYTLCKESARFVLRLNPGENKGQYLVTLKVKNVCEFIVEQLFSFFKKTFVGCVQLSPFLLKLAFMQVHCLNQLNQFGGVSV